MTRPSRPLRMKRYLSSSCISLRFTLGKASLSMSAPLPWMHELPARRLRVLAPPIPFALSSLLFMNLLHKSGLSFYPYNNVDKLSTTSLTNLLTAIIQSVKLEYSASTKLEG